MAYISFDYNTATGLSGPVCRPILERSFEIKYAAQKAAIEVD